MSGVLDGSALPIEECCGEEEFLKVEQDIIETAEDRDTITSYQLKDRLSKLFGHFDWDRENDDDIQKADIV